MPIILTQFINTRVKIVI